MQETRQAPASGDVADDQQTVAIDKLIRLINSTPRAQFERVLQPLLEQQPGLWDFVVARLTKLVDELRDSGRLDGPANAIEVDSILEVMALRLSSSADDGFDFDGRAKYIRLVEQYGLYRVLLELPNVKLSEGLGFREPRYIARDAIASLSKTFMLLERTGVIPGLRKRILRQVEDVVISHRVSRASGTPIRAEQVTVDVPTEADGPADLKSRRRDMIAAYKAEVTDGTGQRLTDEALAKAACPDWSDRTQISWYKSVNRRQSVAAVDLIEKLLRKRPHLRR